MRKYLLLFLLIIGFDSFSQTAFHGFVLSDKSKLPIEGAEVTLLPNAQSATSDIRGRFHIFSANKTPQSIQISCIGYETIMLAMASFTSNDSIFLQPKNVTLSEILVNSKEGQEYKTVSNFDIKLKGANNSQEILRMIPGLFIGQHQGGGKAEQIFIRGFDSDHGTDINITADGMPVNMVSQAHGQGYADMHFIIPETVAQVEFQKGPYNAAKGNFTTAGYVDLKTKNVINENLVKVEGGMFDTYRIMGMYNLLGKAAQSKQQSWYAAAEYAYSNDYFDYPQNFHRFNFFTKYNGKLLDNSFLTISASHFTSKWNATGQIPDRAVADGMIGFYGAIDSSEGGATSRLNVNAQLITTLKNGAYLKNQIYYSNYHFDLNSNFTFFLIDPINGDQIRQKEDRNLFGYTGSYNNQSTIGSIAISSEAGVGMRWDLINNSLLARTKDRFTALNTIALGDISEANAYGYINETFHFTKKLKLNAGLRFDQFYNQYTNHLKLDSVFKTGAPIWSPKLSLYYQQAANTQFYLNMGKGFHSNNTKVAIMEKGRKVLPAAYAIDLGTICKPRNNLLIQAAVWHSYLEQEFVYNGDDGTAEPSGKSVRTGLDASIRYEPLKALYIDADINYAHAKFVDELKGNDFIPLAPVWSSTGGITYKKALGFNGSLRYRWLSNRPANEDNSLIANGYFVNDVVVNFTQKKYEIGLTVANVFNVKWKETQFETESRLKNETNGVNEIHFTAGTKLAAKLSLAIYF